MELGGMDLPPAVPEALEIGGHKMSVPFDKCRRTHHGEEPERFETEGGSGHDTGTGRIFPISVTGSPPNHERCLCADVDMFGAFPERTAGRLGVQVGNAGAVKDTEVAGIGVELVKQ